MESVSFREQLVSAIPSLRAFGLRLTRKEHLADDLVQETLVRAWEHQHQFVPGTNFRAWVFTILRNRFFTNCKLRKREVQDADGTMSSLLVQLPAQQSNLDLKEFRIALDTLCPEQRRALMLVGGEGFSYEEAATMCNVPAGTIKSRVCRARRHLKDLAPENATLIEA